MMIKFNVMWYLLHLFLCLISLGSSDRVSVSWKHRSTLTLRGGARAHSTSQSSPKGVSTLETNSQTPPPRVDDASQRVTVVTTASLPWMTGTSVNPLLRAAHLTVDRDEGAVTLMVPWVELEDQRRLFPNNITFASQEEQRRYVLKWVSEKANMPAAARKVLGLTQSY